MVPLPLLLSALLLAAGGGGGPASASALTYERGLAASEEAAAAAAALRWRGLGNRSAPAEAEAAVEAAEGDDDDDGGDDDDSGLRSLKSLAPKLSGVKSLSTAKSLGLTKSVLSGSGSLGGKTSMAEEIAFLPAPAIGSTESAAPFMPMEVSLELGLKRWEGTENLKATFHGYMEEYGDGIEGLMEKYNFLQNFEAVALMAYTTGDYDCMNNVLRGRKSKYAEEEVAMAGVFSQLATAALDRLTPIGSETLWRGTYLPKFAMKALEEQNFLYDPAFISASRSSKVAAEFVADDEDGVILCIVCPDPKGGAGPGCKGKSVKEFSYYPEEEEVLFPPGTKFAKMSKGEVTLGTDEGVITRTMYVLQPWF